MVLFALVPLKMSQYVALAPCCAARSFSRACMMICNSISTSSSLPLRNLLRDTRASSVRPLLSNHRGDSGWNQIKEATTLGTTRNKIEGRDNTISSVNSYQACRTRDLPTIKHKKGILHAQSLLILDVRLQMPEMMKPPTEKDIW